jgi:disintegrin and metalloproteinase domain-containing protein 10
VRTKVPLKKKVRGERKKKSSTKASALPQKENILPNSSANAATSPTLPVSILPLLKPLSSKRQSKSTDSPRKLLRKKTKKRPSSEESTPKKEVEATPLKPSRKLKKKSKQNKEVIDYSNPENHTNTFGKVQKWLLESPIVSSAASQIEHASKISNIMSKSQSTPEHLVAVQRSPNNTKTKSTTNLNDKVRLQVVYKPPFKFSLKFSKNDPSVKTKVIGIDKNKRNNGRVDRKRNSMEDPMRSRRTALLIRSATEEINKQLVNDLVDEPLYETLNPKLNPPQHQRQKSLTMPNDGMPNYYENIPSSSTANLIDLSLTNSTTSPINTATFRVNKSASGSNITNRNLPVVATPVLSKSRRTPSQKGSQQNLTSTNGSGGRERRSSIGNSSNLIKFGGSSQNLTRSSTTNLTKNRQDGVKRHASDMNRSSTTNLNKYHRQQSSHGSNSNLRRDGSNMDVNAGEDYHCISSNERKSHSRKNSVNMKESMGSKSNLPRTYSNSNLMSSGPMPGSSRRESFNNNIPRASLINPISSSNASNQFNRQISLNVKPQMLSQQSRQLIDEVNKNRPNTSSCDSSMFKNFEWPKVLTTQRSLPVNDASDMEVMVSDVENLVNDR